MNSAHKDLTDRKGFIAMDTATLEKQTDWLSAFNTWVAMSGKKPKQICDAIGMDASQWSRCKTGDAHFPMQKYRLLANFLQSDSPLQYLLWEGDYEPRLIMRKTAAERAIEERDRRIAELEHENRILANAIRGRING